METERLLNLARLLETDPDIHSRQHLSPTSPTIHHRSAAFDMGVWCERDICGTTACALGWYALKFPDRGIHPNFDLNLPRAEEEFGLTIPQAKFLFLTRMSEPDHSPEYVAQRIRDFVASPKIADAPERYTNKYSNQNQ